MDTAALFEAGCDAYWAGECPDGWDDPAQRERSPFLMGWFMESEFEVGGVELDTRRR